MRQIPNLFESLAQDLRYGARTLLRTGRFTAVAVVALAIGIGVNTAVFTAYKAFVARPLDARDPLRESGSARAGMSFDLAGEN